jgi:MFS transporter, OFA family, oxalate/formate antiporter
VTGSLTAWQVLKNLSMSTPSAELSEILVAAPIATTRGLATAPRAEPQPIFYGWVILPLAFLMMLTTSPGQTFGVSYFNEEFVAEFGVSKTALSAAYFFATLLAACALTFIGAMVDRWGLRRMTLIGFTAMGLACLFASQATGVLTLFAAFSLLRLFGPGTMTLLANNSLAAWFDCRLGTASSAAQIAMAGASAIIPTGIVLLIEAVGWRGAYLVFAGIVGGCFLPLMAIFFRQSPRDIGQVPDGMRFHAAQRYKPFSYGNEFTLGESLQHRSYWILLFTIGVWSLIATGLIFHLVALFQASGFRIQDSTRAVTVLALTTAMTQLVGGVLADRLAMRWLLVTAFLLLAASCGVLTEVGDQSKLILGYGVYGCGQGIISVVSGTVWARYFGRNHLGKIRGLSLTVAVGASAVGPVIMGISADYFGGFNDSLWLFSAMSVLCAGVSCWATPPRTWARL